jgi:dihydrofolate reductase
VVTRQKDFKAANCSIVHSLEEGLALAGKNKEEETFIIGGAEIYTLGLPMAKRLYLTEIDATIDGDTFFPEIKKPLWRETSRVHHPADSRHKFAFDFIVYERKGAL